MHIALGNLCHACDQQTLQQTNNIFLVKSEKSSDMMVEFKACLPGVKTLSASKYSVSRLRKHLQEVHVTATVAENKFFTIKHIVRKVIKKE